jgi:hypothetical protein
MFGTRIGRERPMTTHQFEGEIYNDDRMFVLYLCKGVITEIDEETFQTTIHHGGDPEEFVWCLVTFRNTHRYPVYRVDHFDSMESARTYVQHFEPRVPLISLGGNSPAAPMTYEIHPGSWKTAFKNTITRRCSVREEANREN